MWSHMVTGWSQVVTLVTVMLQDLNNNGLDGYHGSKTSA